MKQQALAVFQRASAAGIPVEGAFLTRAAPVNRHQRRQQAAQQRARKHA